VVRRAGIDVRCSAKQQKAKAESSVSQKTFVYDGDDPTLQVWEHDGTTDERDADQSIAIRELDVDAEGLPTTASLGAPPPPQNTDEVFEGEARCVHQYNAAACVKLPLRTLGRFQNPPRPWLAAPLHALGANVAGTHYAR
jgi:hypothetical protein